MRGARVVRVLGPLLDRATQAAKVREVLFVEKRKETGTQKLVVPWTRLEIVFYSFFYCPRVEILADGC
jgi:hypothetical protein